MAQENVVAMLRITYADGHEQVIELRQNTIVLGRSAPSDVLLPDSLVSRQHARLLFEVDRISLVDLNSKNGTFIETTKISPNAPYRLSIGSAFRIEPFMLRLEPAAKPIRSLRAEGESTSSSEKAPVQAQIGGEDFSPSGGLPPPSLSVRNGDFPDNHRFGLPTDVSRYMQYLPPLYQEHDLLGRLLLSFEGVLVPIEQTIDNFDLHIDPLTTPDHFLDRLAGWLGLTLDEKWASDKRRTLVAEASELYRQRGTRWGLSRHLEIYTDVVPEISEATDRPHHFRVVLRIPAGRAVDRSAVERIIQANQPAHTTYNLEVVASS